MSRVSAGAAYQKLTVPKTDMAETARAFGGISAANRRASQQINEQKEAREKAAKQKKYDDLTKDLKGEGISGTMINHKSIDDITMSAASQFTDKAVNAEILSKEAYRNGNMQEGDRLRALSKKYRSNFKTYDNFLNVIKPRIEEYMKNRDDYNPYDKRYKMQDAFLKKNVVVYADDNGEMKIILGLDKDGDGEISNEEREQVNEYIRAGGRKGGELEYEEIDPHDFMDGFYDQYKKVNLIGKDGVIDQLASNIGTLTEDENTGNYTLTTTGFDENKREELYALSKAQLKNPETMAWVANTGLSILDKVDNFSPEEEEAAAKWLTDQTIAKYNIKISEKVNPLTPEERKLENARNRAVQRRGQDLGVEKHQKGLDNAWRIANLKKNKDGGKLSDEEKLKEVSMYAYKLAKKLHDLPESQQNDVAVKKILEEEGIEFDSGWKMRDGNQFELKDGDGNWKWADQKSIHTTANLISSQLGVDYDRKSVVVEKERKLDGKTDDSTTKLSDEEYEKILREAAGN